MKWKVGDFYRSKTGEVLQVLEFTKDEARFLALDPLTLEPTDYELHGPLWSIELWAKECGIEKINIETYKPTGLVEDEKAT